VPAAGLASSQINAELFLIGSSNVKSVFDKIYAASGFIERNWHFLGDPRCV